MATVSFRAYRENLYNCDNVHHVRSVVEDLEEDLSRKKQEVSVLVAMSPEAWLKLENPEGVCSAEYTIANKIDEMFDSIYEIYNSLVFYRGLLSALEYKDEWDDLKFEDD